MKPSKYHNGIPSWHNLENYFDEFAMLQLNELSDSESDYSNDLWSDSESYYSNSSFYSNSESSYESVENDIDENATPPRRHRYPSAREQRPHLPRTHYQEYDFDADSSGSSSEYSIFDTPPQAHSYDDLFDDDDSYDGYDSNEQDENRRRPHSRDWLGRRHRARQEPHLLDPHRFESLQKRKTHRKPDVHHDRHAQPHFHEMFPDHLSHSHDQPLPAH